jgi:hypothetical protein
VGRQAAAFNIEGGAMTERTDTGIITDDSWLAQLKQLRQADEARQRVQELQRKRLQDQTGPTADLMSQSRAHALLRQVQKVLLGGEGIINVYEDVEGYDQALVLMWQGAVSKARKPDWVEEPYSYILVGVKEGQVWVNGQALSEASPEAMKTALLAASKEPKRRWVGGTGGKQKRGS